MSARLGRHTRGAGARVHHQGSARLQARLRLRHHGVRWHGAPRGGHLLPRERLQAGLRHERLPHQLHHTVGARAGGASGAGGGAARRRHRVQREQSAAPPGHRARRPSRDRCHHCPPLLPAATTPTSACVAATAPRSECSHQGGPAGCRRRAGRDGAARARLPAGARANMPAFFPPPAGTRTQPRETSTPRRAATGTCSTWSRPSAPSASSDAGRLSRKLPHRVPRAPAARAPSLATQCPFAAPAAGEPPGARCRPSSMCPFTLTRLPDLGIALAGHLCTTRAEAPSSPAGRHLLPMAAICPAKHHNASTQQTTPHKYVRMITRQAGRMHTGALLQTDSWRRGAARRGGAAAAAGGGGRSSAIRAAIDDRLRIRTVCTSPQALRRAPGSCWCCRVHEGHVRLPGFCGPCRDCARRCCDCQPSRAPPPRCRRRRPRRSASGSCGNSRLTLQAAPDSHPSRVPDPAGGVHAPAPATNSRRRRSRATAAAQQGPPPPAVRTTATAAAAARRAAAAGGGAAACCRCRRCWGRWMRTRQRRSPR